MIAASETLSKLNAHSTWLGQSIQPSISRLRSSAAVPASPISYLGAALAVALLITSGAAQAQRDSFTYETPKQRAADNVRESIAQTSYRCARSIAFGDINGGVRKRSQIDRDPRMLNCFNIILHSRWFPENAKLPLFEKIVNRAIDDVIASGQL
jgi:hypothetical protein